MKERLRKIFQGRYGIDNLSFFILIFAVLLFRIRYLWILGIVLTGYVIYRIFSKNLSKRQVELQQFNNVVMNIRRSIQPLFNKLGIFRTRLQQRKEYVFVSCPKCKKTLRLPRNKGKLQVTCPVCSSEFIKKT